MVKKQPKPQFNEDGTLDEKSLRLIVKWGAEDFSNLATFVFLAWDKAMACSRNVRTLRVTVGESVRNKEIIAALVENEAWWKAYWYGSMHGARHEFRERL